MLEYFRLPLIDCISLKYATPGSGPVSNQDNNRENTYVTYRTFTHDVGKSITPKIKA